LKYLCKHVKISFKMETMGKDAGPLTPRPPCFGEEAKFAIYMETLAGDSECARCPSEDDCGEFILLKCSRELIF
jgi:hypothetical protein